MKKIKLIAAVMAALAISTVARATPVGYWTYDVFGTKSTTVSTFNGPVNILGTLSQTGNQSEATAGSGALNGGGTAATYSQVLGLFATPSSIVGNGGGQNFGVNASSTIPVNSTNEILVSSASAGNITLTSTPNISTFTLVGGSTPLPDGTWLVLTSSSTNAITFQSNGSLSNSGLFLGAATRAVALHKTLGLKLNCIAQPCVWEEQFYINDNN